MERKKLTISLPSFGISRHLIDIFSKRIPSNEVDPQTIKDDIWADLAALYYKYDDNDQKIAFREITREISNKLVEGNWDSVYKKLYQKDKASKNIHYPSHGKGI